MTPGWGLVSSRRKWGGGQQEQKLGHKVAGVLCSKVASTGRWCMVRSSREQVLVRRAQIPERLGSLMLCCSNFTCRGSRTMAIVEDAT